MQLFAASTICLYVPSSIVMITAAVLEHPRKSALCCSSCLHGQQQGRAHAGPSFCPAGSVMRHTNPLHQMRQVLTSITLQPEWTVLSQFGQQCCLHWFLSVACKLTFFCAMIYDLPFCIELYSGYQAMTTCWPKSKHLDTHNKKPLQPVKYSIALQASFCLFLAVGIGHIEWTCGRALYMYQFLLYSQFQYVS